MHYRSKVKKTLNFPPPEVIDGVLLQRVGPLLPHPAGRSAPVQSVGGGREEAPAVLGGVHGEQGLDITTTNSTFARIERKENLL